MKKILLLILLMSSAMTVRADSVSPYVGQEIRGIKALSQQRINDLLEGKGLGYGKVAELNGYPGPAHVIELAEQLQLSEEQLIKTNKLFIEMKRQAKKLGAELVEAEKQLDLLFNLDEISETIVLSMLENIGNIEGKLRAAHVTAHLKQKAILSPHQVHLYNNLRGYRAEKQNKDHHRH